MPFPPLFFVASKILDQEAAVLDPVNWTVLGGVLVNCSYFSSDLTNVFGQASGLVKTVGVGAQLRIVEIDALGVSVTVATFNVPNTAGQWMPSMFDTTVQLRPGDMLYQLEGMLGGAVSCSARFFSTSLLQTVFGSGV